MLRLDHQLHFLGGLGQLFVHLISTLYRLPEKKSNKRGMLSGEKFGREHNISAKQKEELQEMAF